MANFKTLKVRGSFKASRLIGNADTATVILDNKLSTSGSITLATLDPGKYSYNHSTSGITITDHPSPGNDFFLEVIPVDLEANIKRQIIHTMASLKTLNGTAQTPVVYERNINYDGIGSQYRLSGYGKIHFTAVTNGHYEVNGISVSSDTGYYVALGTSVTIKAIADENHRITSFTVNGHSIENTYTTTITGLDTFSMSTSIDAINISITQPTGATISVRYDGNDYTSSFSMTRNKPIVVTITPEEKYTVNALYWNGVAISSGSTQTPTEDASITADVSIKRISVELPTSISNGSVSAIANGTTYTNSFVVDYGTKVTINAKADTGYHLNSLKNGSDNITSGTTLTATSTISISCSFVINIYTVNITQPAANGTITVTSAGEHHTSNFTVTHGTTITIVATPNTGYDFKSLLVNGNSFTSGDSMVVTDDVTIIGSTNTNSYLVTIIQPANGTISAVCNGVTYTSNFYADFGSTVKVSLVADTGYHIDDITWNGNSVADGSTQTVTGNLTLTGSVSANIYTLSFTNPTGATFSILYQGRWYYNTLSVLYGSTVRIQLNADTGYIIDSIKLNDTDITNGSDHIITEACTITATTSLKTYTVTITNPVGATISATVGSTVYTNAFTANYGTSIKYNITASTGYDITSFTYGETTINDGDTKVLTGDVTVTAAAALKTYEVNIIQPSDGTIKVGGNTSKFTAKHFSSYDVTLTPSTGYSVKSLTWNGEEIANGSKQTVIGATTVTGSTSAVSQSVNIIQVANGTISITYKGKEYTSSTDDIPYGSKVTVNAKPDTGYDLTKLTVNGETITSGSEITITGTTNITAAFGIHNYTITIIQNEHQTITVTCNGVAHTETFTATYGQTWTASIVADIGYITASTISPADSGTVTGDITIEPTAAPSLKYLKLTIGKVVGQTQLLKLSTSTIYGGTLPAYNTKPTQDGFDLTVPYGTHYSITYASVDVVGYDNTISEKVSGSMTVDTAIPAKSTKYSLKYYTLNIASTSGLHQSYSLTLKGSDKYGGDANLPSYSSAARTDAYTLRVPYDATYTITYIADTGYKPGATKTGTVVENINITTHSPATALSLLILQKVENGYWEVNGVNVGSSYSKYYDAGTSLKVECFANEGYIKPTELTMS